MSASTETSIWLALKSRVNTLSLTLPKAWPGQMFEVAGREGYLRIGRVSAAPARMMIANAEAHSREGFLIITLVYKLGQAIEAYDQMAGNIAQHFIDGTTMRSGNVCVMVPSYPQVVEGYEDSGYWNVPVRIPWIAFA